MTPTENAQSDADRRAAACNAQLETLAGVANRVRSDIAQMHYLTNSAHSLGASWKEIGDVLGCSRQSAWERFGQSLRHSSVKGDAIPQEALPFDLG